VARPQRIAHRLKQEDGVIAILFALILVVLFAAVAFTVDLSRLFHERQVLQNAVDFGALAGGMELPAQGSVAGAAAQAEALRVTLDNAPNLSSSSVTIAFKCVVGDRNNDGAPDAEDVPFVCGPTSGSWSAGTWRVKGPKVVHDCNPYVGDKCNTISVRTNRDVPYYFAPVIGINQGNTGSVSAASCNGACGAASSPLDVVMVIDRTGSMTAADLANAKNAALSVLDFYDAQQQWVGIVALPYPQPSNKCAVNNPQLYPASAASLWQVSPLSSNYDLSNGLPDPASQIVKNIKCLVVATNPTVRVSGVDKTAAGHTNLGDPLDAAREMLLTQGRSNVPDVIIFMTDGEANQPDGLQPCNYLNTKATQAKAANQTIFTIGYGVAGAKCSRDTSPPFKGKFASTNLALAATNSTDDSPGGCGPLENRDGDNYFCESGSGDLEPVFRQVAAASVGSARLIDDF
jgi:hypothetical protein